MMKSIEFIKKYNLYLNIMFWCNAILLGIGTMIGGFQEVGQVDQSVGGWILIVLPIMLSLLLIPQLIGCLLSFININKNSKIMDVFIIICAALSLVTNIFILSFEFKNIIIYLSIIQCILLILMCCYKLFLKEEKIYCNKCGNRNEIGANFCTSCGASLKATSQSVQDATAKNNIVKENVRKKNNKL